MRVLDDVHGLTVVVVRVGHDQLVDVVVESTASSASGAAEGGQAVVGVGTRRADEVIVDPAATLPERLVESRPVLPFADQDRPSANAGQLGSRR